MKVVMVGLVVAAGLLGGAHEAAAQYGGTNFAPYRPGGAVADTKVAGARRIWGTAVSDAKVAGTFHPQYRAPYNGGGAVSDAKVAGSFGRVAKSIGGAAADAKAAAAAPKASD